MKQGIFLITVILFSNLSFSQESPDEMVTSFFEKFKNNGSADALNFLYDYNQWISKSSDDVILLKNQMASLTEEYIGNYFGYEKIVEKKLSDSFILKSYLVKYARQPLRFTFKFYKPNDTWIFYGFSYDANLSEEIEEAAKLYRFRLN